MPNAQTMTRLLVDLSDDRDLQVLLPLLNRLHIPYRRMETGLGASDAEREEALRIVRQGCDMTTFGDALAYQRRVREDRVLPYREE